MVFFQFKIIVRICEFIAIDQKIDNVQLLFKDKDYSLAVPFTVDVLSLNDFFFESFHIVLNRKDIFGSSYKIGYVSFRLGDFKKESNTTLDYAVYSAESFSTLDYYKKCVVPIGRVKLHIQVIRVNSSCIPAIVNSPITNFLNKLIRKDITSSFSEIKEILAMLLYGFPTHIIKVIRGYILKEKEIIKNRACDHIDHNGDYGCFKDNCIEGYSPIPKDFAKEGLQAAKYALTAFIDSVIVRMFLHKTSEKFGDIKNKKVKAILEMAEDINEDNIVKYVNGSQDSIGFTLFISGDKVVINFRGTLSTDDVISDINCSYKPFYNGFTHNGIFRISKTFLDNERNTILKKMEEQQIKKVLLTGHSLGGAVASLMYIMLKKDNEFKDFVIKAFAFSAPPTVSKEILNAVDFSSLISINYGNDVIPKLSIGAILDFKYICVSIASDPDLKHSVFSNNVENVDSICAKTNEIRSHLLKTNLFPKLYQPGVVYHIKPYETEKKKGYMMKKVNTKFFANLTHFKDLIVDHWINRQISAFESV